jgi:hypothetical protein
VELFLSVFDFVLVLPFILQAIAFVFDEFYFHWKRGLGRWEMIGHPLDTLSVILFYLSLYLLDLKTNQWIVLLFGVFSCIFITKDEWVHSKLCKPAENWLHAVLFMVHPCCFIAAWKIASDNLTIFGVLESRIFILQLVLSSVVVIAYQIIFWGLKTRLKSVLKTE